MRSYYHEIMGMAILPQYLSLKLGAYARYRHKRNVTIYICIYIYYMYIRPFHHCMVKNNFRFSIGLPSNLVKFGVRNICATLFAYKTMFSDSSRHAKFCKMTQPALFALKSLVIL